MWVFLFKQKTAYGMRISDWSSDVCSSDLLDAGALQHGAQDLAFLDDGLAELVDRNSAINFTEFRPWQSPVSGRPKARNISGARFEPVRRRVGPARELLGVGDRKSTRLNSSH